ncbi:hypothetical protein T05_10741 [Trichinella murrelli]|uniref:Uncharacterized protein n=1 Tax=Trichinella murrelli TaxID=144512 RepID=A0A0V0U8H4_9BILA|nr:hypothetical protein T05_10741 [Trichinella murrelli]
MRIKNGIPFRDPLDKGSGPSETPLKRIDDG